MSLQEILEKEAPDISEWDRFVQAWAEFAAGDPEPNEENYRIQEQILAVINPGPNIRFPTPLIGMEGSKAHLNESYKPSANAQLWTRDVQAYLTDAKGRTFSIVSAHGYGEEINKANDKLLFVTSNGRFAKFENNNFWTRDTYGFEIRNSVVREWPGVIGGASDGKDWHIYSTDFRTCVYSPRNLKPSRVIGTPDELKGMVEKGEHATSFSFGSVKPEGLTSYRTSFLTNRGKLVVGNHRGSLGRKTNWDISDNPLDIDLHNDRVAQKRWRFRQGKQEYLLFPDGEVCDAEHPRMRFYRYK